MVGATGYNTCGVVIFLSSLVLRSAAPNIIGRIAGTSCTFEQCLWEDCMWGAVVVYIFLKKYSMHMYVCSICIFVWIYSEVISMRFTLFYFLKFNFLLLKKIMLRIFGLRWQFYFNNR